MRQPPLQFLTAAQDPAGILLELGASDLQALQPGSELRLVFTQFRQLEARDGLSLGGFHLRLRLLGDECSDLVQVAGRLGLRFLGLHPAGMEQDRLVPADFRRQHLEPVGLARLALEALDLAFELRGNVVQALEIGFGSLQPQFRLMAARMQAGNAGRLLEQLPARLRLGGDQLADAALAHHRGRACTGGRIGKQQLHVLGARLLAIDAVDRALLALDAARHLYLVAVVEGCGRGAVAVVQIQADLGRVARRAVAGSGKITSSMPEARMFL